MLIHCEIAETKKSAEAWGQRANCQRGGTLLVFWHSKELYVRGQNLLEGAQENVADYGYAD
jgi:hypothetical protein